MFSRHLCVAGLALGAALMAATVPLPAEAVERLYARGVYAYLQPAVTGFSSLVPVALLDLAVVVILLGGGAAIVRAMRSPRSMRPAAVPDGGVMPRSPLAALAAPAAWILLFAAAGYVWFLLFWGLNYRRVPLEGKLAYDDTLVTADRAAAFARHAAERLHDLTDAPQPDAADEAALGDALARLARTLGSPRPVRIAAPKRSLLTWYFRQAAIDGMTDPFFLEIILNPDLLPAERPFVLAHEWAHLAGYAAESEANFVAWLACVRGTPATQYSGWLAAFQHVAPRLARSERQALRASLPPRAIADIEASARRVARASPAVQSAARGAYDAYLRANRVEQGIGSYGAVVRLMLGTTFDEGWTPQLRR